jgi:tetratricopeptide (TPR) repeat protein
LFGVLVLAVPTLAVAQTPGGVAPAVSPPREPDRRAAPAGNADVKALLVESRQKGRSAQSVEQCTEALRILKEAQQNNQTAATEAYVKRLAAWIYNRRGELLVKQAEQAVGETPQQAVAYEQAALRDFDLAVALDAERWQARYNRAVSRAITGQYEGALADLDLVLERQPDHVNARFNRAEIRYQTGAYAAAADDYSRVIELDPEDTSALAGRGLCRFRLEQHDAALLDFNNVVRLRPDDAEAYAQRADLFASLGQWERAAGDYRVAIRLDKQLGRAYHNVAWLMATCPDQRFRNGELAVRAARKAIELDGASHRYLDTLAAALASAGQFQQARDTMLQALQDAPDGEAPELRQRMALYESDRPYRETNRSVRLASAEE